MAEGNITYLAVPYEDRNKAMQAAGKLPDGSNALGFDRDEKLWYAKPGADLSNLSEWIPKETQSVAPAGVDPQVEFAQVLENAGFVLDGLPEMDGRSHRVPTLEDKRGQKTGVYAGFLDGHPAGWFQDYRNHTEAIKWKATGQHIDPADREQFRAQAAQRRMERDAERQRIHNHAAHRASQAYALMPDASDDQAYLEKKGVKAYPGVHQDKRGRLVIPLRNEADEIRSIQRIDAGSFKSLKKNGQKEGNFFIVGDREITNGEPVLYAEGYSTAASVAMATDRPVVMTVDAGNLPRVAEKFKALYPDSAHLILGDDDRKNKENKGLIKAQEAAEITNGTYAVPVFTEEEAAAGLTDFNDLHQARGLAAVREQVDVALATITKDKPMAEERTTDAPIVTEDFDRFVSDSLQDQPIEQQQEPVQIPEEVPTASPALKEEDSQPLVDEDSDKYGSITTDDVQRWRQQSRLSLESLLSERERQQFQPVLSNMVESERVNPNEQDPTPEASKPGVPDHLSKTYVEVNGNYYFSQSPDTLAFVDKGSRLQTRRNDNKIAQSLVDIAESRGWQELRVKGTLEFRREAWLVAASKGLTVRGYKPQEKDLAALKALVNKKNPNEVVNESEQSQEQSNDSREGEQKVNRLHGTLIEHGKAPYENKPDNRASYFVTLENADGQQHTSWGVGLEKAMEQSGAKPGDHVELEQKGREAVTVQQKVKDEQGNVIGTKPLTTHRNAWEVKAEAIRNETDHQELLRNHPDMVNEVAAIKVAEKFSQRFDNEADRKRFMQRVQNRVAEQVENGQKAPSVKVREVKVQTKEQQHER